MHIYSLLSTESQGRNKIMKIFHNDPVLTEEEKTRKPNKTRKKVYLPLSIHLIPTILKIITKMGFMRLLLAMSTQN